MTAVTLEEEAILQALIMMSSSMRLSLISPQPLWIMYTSSPLTLSPISTLGKAEGQPPIKQGLARSWAHGWDLVQGKDTEPSQHGKGLLGDMPGAF